jgi:hypothetical protein
LHMAFHNVWKAGEFGIPRRGFKPLDTVRGTRAFRCGFNRWTQSVGGIVEPVSRSLKSFLGLSFNLLAIPFELGLRDIGEIHSLWPKAAGCTSPTKLPLCRIGFFTSAKVAMRACVAQTGRLIPIK